ncbi:hypothetical protein DEJ51_05570 [Streptomyces venezuelae]|uniref:Uncharacterized protein n=1 Tax=Streptomyces venezuelae TaxID=54571 RepID=A0A5P2DKF2_STRVZ|nr:hypothetical protein [Streptomyces venezuelae]QES53781.1 hypothetical protein DEJ51_05570 [Streptomyces venezuelae]
MDGNSTDEVLASKWDLPVVIGTAARVAFGGLPLWAKALIIGLLASVILWYGITWQRERGRRSR